MLRSIQHLRDTSVAASRLADNEEQLTLLGGGPEYRMAWHWHDCLMVFLPHVGAVDFRDETRRSGAWLSEDRFVVVPRGLAHQTAAVRPVHRHLAIYASDGQLAKARRLPKLLEIKSAPPPRLRAGAALVVVTPAKLSVTGRVSLCMAPGGRLALTRLPPLPHNRCRVRRSVRDHFRRAGRYDRTAEESAMIWETPTVEDIACGMEVTAYAPAVEAVPAPAQEDAADER